MYLTASVSITYHQRPRPRNFQCQKTMENPDGSDASKFHQNSRGKKNMPNNVGVRQRKDRKKVLETPTKFVIPNILSMNFFRLYILHAFVSSKLRCRCYIFFLYSRFLTLGKTLIRIMPEFGILSHIYIDSEAHFLSTFLCTNWSLTTPIGPE